MNLPHPGPPQPIPSWKLFPPNQPWNSAANMTRPYPSLVFASGRGGAKNSVPAPHRTRGRGMKFRPRPAPQRAGPRTGNGAGDHLTGPAWGTATGPRRYLRGPACFSGAPPYIWCPARVPVFCRQGVKCRPRPAPPRHSPSGAPLCFRGPAFFPGPRLRSSGPR